MAFVVADLSVMGTHGPTGRRVWGYVSTVDDAETILVDGYFNSTNHSIAVNDIILIFATNAIGLVGVASIVSNSVNLRRISALSLGVDGTTIEDLGGTAPSTPSVQDYLQYFASRINLKLEDVNLLGDGISPTSGIDASAASSRKLNIRKISAGTGIRVELINDGIVISTSDTTAPPPSPTDNRTGNYNTGLRRLHVSPDGTAPLDGSTPDVATFTNLQTALNNLTAGDVLTIGAGDYFGTFSLSNLAGTVSNPVWIAEEQLGTVRILNVDQTAFDGTRTWTSQGGGRFSSDIGSGTYMGVHNGDFLPKYSSIANLNATSVNGKNKPSYGITSVGNVVHIKLRNNLDPNGQVILLTDGSSQDVISFTNCDNVIWDGCQIEGGGEQAAVSFDTASANPTIRNVRSYTSRFVGKFKDDGILEWCDYGLADPNAGGKTWMRECINLNGNERAAFFDIIKGDLAQGGNAVYEGGICRGAGGFVSGTTHSNCEFRFNRHVGTFEGERFGEFQSSESHENVYDEIGDDAFQFEDDRNSNHGNNNRAYYNRIRNPHGPAFSHQNSGSATHDVIRNLIEITEPSVFRPEFFLKMIRTADGSTIRYAHNYFENFATAGTRSPWYPFATPTGTGVASGGDEITHFVNNIVVFPGDVNPSLPQAAGSPGTTNGNAYVGPNSESSIQGGSGIFSGTVKDSLDLNSEFVPQAGSALISAGVALPAGMTDPTTISGSRDIGVFEENENPGSNWPRSLGLEFNFDLPSRWTSPGS